jgi:hypothetical protein
MIPTNYDLPTAYRGDSYGPIILYPKDSNGQYLNLYNSDINVHVKNKKNCATVLTWSTENNTIHVQDLISGGLWSGAKLILAEIDGCEMQMPSNSYLYDIQISRGIKAQTFYRGGFFVSGDITQVIECDCGFGSGSAVFIDECYCSMKYAFKAEIVDPCGYNSYCASAVSIDGCKI